MSSTALQTSSTTSGEQYRRKLKRSVYDFPKVPTPIYRHAAPSAPWPWMKFDVDSSEVQPVSPSLSDAKWCHYPQSLFGNWTWDQVNRSQMLTKCSDSELSTIFKFGVFEDGNFDQHIETHTVGRADDLELQMYWDDLGIAPPSNLRVQALFIEDMTLPILQMLGTKYNVEPFFFASSVNWIPSMYEEDPKTLEDHITVVIPFVRTLKKDQQPIMRAHPIRVPTLTSTESQEEPLPYNTEEERVIDTQAPLSLPNNKILVQDLLSLHMVRRPTTSTIISYHPSLDGTSAMRLQSLAHRTGDSVYWSNIYKRSKDPTFFFLAILWYALYAWDESFEVLSLYISALEHQVLQFNDIKLTRELHKVQAHLLYYQQLLRDYLRSVEFVRDSPSPAMGDPSIPEEEREDSAKLLRIESDNLRSEIKRLTGQREMLSDRLENAIRLTFATKRIEDTKARKDLREAAMRDSAAIKLINYLSLVYFPATYLTNVFRMPVREIVIYTEVTIVLTVITSWLAITIQQDSPFFPSNSSFIRRTFWPLFYVTSTVKGWFRSTGRRSRQESPPLLAFVEGQP